MKPIKFGVIGGGSIFSPELVDLLTDEMDTFGDIHITFMDIDRQRQGTVGSLCQRIIKRKSAAVSIEFTDSYEKAIEGSSFILIQFRVGGEDARIDDERIGKAFKIPFVETVSVCGIATFLRTYYEIETLARLINEKSPDAWVLNFANPAGIVAETLSKLGVRKVIGVCNASTRLLQFLKQKLGYSDSDQIEMSWRGLNHLTVVDSILLNGKETLPELISDLGDFESDRIPFEKELVRKIGFLPNQYFQYYFRRNKMVDFLQSQEKVRSEVVKEINAKLLESYKTTDRVPEDLKKRGGSGYSKTVVNTIKSLLTGDNKLHYLVTRNRGSIPELPFDAFVETPCAVGMNTVRPIACERLPLAAESIIRQMKRYEELLIEAAMKRDRILLYQAMMVHPLIGDHHLASGLLDAIIEHNKGWLPAEF